MYNVNTSKIRKKEIVGYVELMHRIGKGNVYNLLKAPRNLLSCKQLKSAPLFFFFFSPCYSSLSERVIRQKILLHNCSFLSCPVGWGCRIH